MSANEEVTARILADLGTADRGVVVDSPPGAGKSTLVVGAAAVLTDGGEQVMIIAQTNEQVDDLTSRMTHARPKSAGGRLAGSGYIPPPRVAGATAAAKVDDLAGCQVIL